MTVISTNKFAAIDFKAPRLPVPPGLLDVVTWPEPGDNPRWFDSGVLVERTNFDGDTGYGVWNEAWNTTADMVNQTKEGERPERDDTPFVHVTAFGYAHNPCGDLREITRNETRERAEATLTHRLGQTVADEFVERLWADVSRDAVSVDSRAGVVLALATLEEWILDRGVTGAQIHAGPKWATIAMASQAVRYVDGAFYTALGNRLVFDAGYREPLGDSLIATTPVVGWKTPVASFESLEPFSNEYISIAEQSVLLAYEAVLAAATVT